MLKLIERCLANDNEAWDELWLIYDRCAATHVRRLLRWAGFDASEADDVAIEIFGSLIDDDRKRLRSFGGSTEAELKSWLVHLAINFTRNWIDTARREKHREGMAIELYTRHDARGPTEDEIRSLFSELESTLSPDDMNLLRSQVGLEADPADPTPDSAKPVSKRTSRRHLHELLGILRKFLGLHDLRKPNDRNE